MFVPVLVSNVCAWFSEFCMTSKAEKPSLSGTRLKTRKRGKFVLIIQDSFPNLQLKNDGRRPLTTSFHSSFTGLLN